MRNNRAGFTLVELMIVIAIASLLSAVAALGMNSAMKKARDQRRKTDIHNIQQALSQYFLDNGHYPASGGAISPNAAWFVSNDNSWTTFSVLLGAYLPHTPKDPYTNNSGTWPGLDFGYGYYSGANAYGCGTLQYMLVYRLETNPNPPSPGITFCDGTYFNYFGTVTSGENASG